MDVSREYIIMCDKATEIQELWDFLSDDFILYDKVNGVCCGNLFKYVTNKTYDKERYIWLPRQDQLQDMVNHGYEIKTNVLKDIYSFKLYNDEYGAKFKSMEQLWLAFVMKENYDKIWEEDQWTPSK